MEWVTFLEVLISIIVFLHLFINAGFIEKPLYDVTVKSNLVWANKYFKI